MGKSMHSPGIEPGSPAWQADIIPLDHECKKISKFGCQFFDLFNLINQRGLQTFRVCKLDLLSVLFLPFIARAGSSRPCDFEVFPYYMEEISPCGPPGPGNLFLNVGFGSLVNLYGFIV